METKELNEALNADFAVVDETDPTEAIPEVKVLDPEEDRENWPTIIVEAENEKPNFAFLCTGGTMEDGRPFVHELKVQRGEEVKVPPSIVNSLRIAVAEHFHQEKDPITGTNKMVGTNRSAIPWQLISRGKYIK